MMRDVIVRMHSERGGSSVRCSVSWGASAGFAAAAICGCACMFPLALCYRLTRWRSLGVGRMCVRLRKQSAPLK